MRRNCRIPIRYFTATEIEHAIRHSGRKNLEQYSEVDIVMGSLNNRLVLVRFNKWSFNIYRDIAITAQMSHLKNVLRLVGCCLEFEKPVMVYEYVEAITLAELLSNKGYINDYAKKTLLSWGNRLRIANAVASALVFLHTEFTTPIIHRDIRPSKVIIDQNSGVAKIVDFSLSISLPPGKLEVEDRACGTVGYLAPEYFISGIITQKTDTYSFGVVLFQLLTGRKVRDIMESDAEEGDVMNRVDFAISEETIDFEEDAESNIVEGNFMDRVDSTIPEETIAFENLPPNLIDHIIKEGNIMNIVDPTILEERGIEIQQQLKDYLNLVKKCTADKGENRPYMIHVARELRRIENCFRALTIGQT